MGSEKSSILNRIWESDHLSIEEIYGKDSYYEDNDNISAEANVTRGKGMVRDNAELKQLGIDFKPVHAEGTTMDNMNDKILELTNELESINDELKRIEEDEKSREVQLQKRKEDMKVLCALAIVVIFVVAGIVLGQW